MIPTWIDGEKELLAVAPTSTKVHTTIAVLETRVVKKEAKVKKSICLVF